MHPITKKLRDYKTKVKEEPVQFPDNTMKVWRFKQKLFCADIVMSRLKMVGTQKNRVYFILRDIPDLKGLCGNCKIETIITAICFFVRCCDGERLHLDKYKVANENELTNIRYAMIVTKISKHYMLKLKMFPLRYIE